MYPFGFLDFIVVTALQFPPDTQSEWLSDLEELGHGWLFLSPEGAFFTHIASTLIFRASTPENSLFDTCSLFS